MQLTIERGATLPFAQLPPKSIALDGYCQGPGIDAVLERFSFDHHDGCIRLVTSATCKQVFDAILLGLNPEGFTVYVNDVDGDTALSVWLLQNPKMVRTYAVELGELVNVVSNMDAHGPAYPMLKRAVALSHAFYEIVMQPERDARASRTYGTLSLDELMAQCLHRIDSLVAGFAVNGEALPPVPPPEKVEYTITHRDESGWVMAQSAHFIFTQLYLDGIDKAVAYDRLPDGSYVYTIGKRSEFIPRFPIGPQSNSGSILAELNRHESGWGGGSSIGGAPRNPDGSRSRLHPDEVFRLIQHLTSAL